jgi:catechol 2,3-dioxygenase-like lactoylglutathione lyase family enzyme
MIIDHVAILVSDAAQTARELRERHGLGSERGAYLALAGTRMHTVWLHPPQYLEFHTIENRAAAESTRSGQAVLAVEAAGFGMLGWAVLVDDLEAVSARLGIEIFDYTVPQRDGTVRGWRAVSGPAHLPFFINYPNNGDRIGRMHRLYRQLDHTSSPTHFTHLTISGSERETRDWLGPNNLPLHFVEGREGITQARIATAAGEVTIS